MVNKKNKLLLIDVGNSSLKWAETPEISFHSMSMSQHLYPEPITSAFFSELWAKIEKPDKIIVSCVANNAVWQALDKACHTLWSLSAERIESLTDGYGLLNSYERATDLGSDRWCAMVAVKQMTDTAFMIVDAGSALTIDIVDESGQHLGGTISPGLSMMKKSLGMNTAQVKVDNTKNTHSSFLGHSTAECVESGIFLSAISLIEAIFEKESLQVKGLQCFLSGGDAEVMADSLSFHCTTHPDIVLRGLAEIQKKYQD